MTIKSNIKENGEILDVPGKINFAECVYQIVNVWGNEGCVFSINGGWGEGKTSFIRGPLTKKFNDNNINHIYLNAFKYDYIENPLLSISGEIYNKITGDTEKKKEVRKNINKVMKIIGKIGIRYLAKGDIPEIENSAESDMEGHVADYIGNSIEEYLEEKESVDILKKSLEEFIEQTGKPLVIVIDEIDRCKPEYAIKFLETIKHFFDIKKLVFIISMNKTQMLEYIETVYGSKNASIYLQKFLDFELELPKTQTNDYYDGEIMQYITHIISSSPIYNVSNLFIKLAEKNNLNYREINTIFNQMILAQKFDSARGFSKYMIIFAILKVKNSTLINGLQTGDFTIINILNELGINDISNPFYDNITSYLSPEKERERRYGLNLFLSLSKLSS